MMYRRERTEASTSSATSSSRSSSRKEMQFLFQHQGHRGILKCERSKILENVRETLHDLGGLPHSSSTSASAIEVHTLQSNRKAAVLRKQAECGNKSYYLLQRYVEEWKTFINVDSLEQLKNRDTLTVAETVVPSQKSAEPEKTKVYL